MIISELVIADSVILKKGQNLKRGAVLGRVKDTGKYKLSDKNAYDGSEIPCAILLEDADATDADKNVPVLLLGVVDGDELIFDDSWDKDELKFELRKMSIFVKNF
jgi:hypothetical protein